jgi:predicted transcriptional regulator
MKQTNHEIQQNQELYDMLVEARQAMTFSKKDAEIDMPDKDEEWKRLVSFSEKTQTDAKETAHQPSVPLKRRLKPQAAIIIGCLFLAGISFAAIHYLSKDKAEQRVENQAITIKETTKSATDGSKTLVVKPAEAEPIVFQDVELQKILETVSDYYKVHVEYQNAHARTVRFYLQWDQKEGLDVLIDKLNHFEKVHITLDSAGNLMTVE